VKSALCSRRVMASRGVACRCRGGSLWRGGYDGEMRFHLRALLIWTAIGPPLFVAAWLGFKQPMLTYVLAVALIGIVLELLIAMFGFVSGRVHSLIGRLPGDDGDNDNDIKF
jgi:hypothetical protein